MNRARGVADGALRVLAGLLHRPDGGFQITQVIQGIKHPEYINAVLSRLGNKSLDHIVGIMAIAQQVLPTQQHLQTRVG